jgi:hypothetical protein
MRFACGDVGETGWIETGCPPPSHRTSLEPESGTGVSNAATERQNRPIWPMFAGRDHANQRLWRACYSQARLGLVRVVVENHSSGYPAVRICRRQCSPSDNFPLPLFPKNGSLAKFIADRQGTVSMTFSAWPDEKKVALLSDFYPATKTFRCTWRSIGLLRKRALAAGVCFRQSF